MALVLCRTIVIVPQEVRRLSKGLCSRIAYAARVAAVVTALWEWVLTLVGCRGKRSFEALGVDIWLYICTIV